MTCMQMDSWLPARGTAVGMLSEDSFTVGTNNYTIDSIFVEGSAGSGTPETLRFSLTNPPLATGDKAGLVLHAGGSSFAFQDSTFVNNDLYTWSSTGLDWSSETSVTLRLTAVPTISSVAVTSTPALTSPGGSTPDTYGEGDTIRFTVTFSEAVQVTGDPQFGFSLVRGDPQFGFSLSGARAADYDSGSGTARLVFAYNVQSGDTDTDGIWVGNHASGTRTLQLDAGDAITSLGGDRRQSGT